MNFHLVQRIAGPPDAVAAAFTDPALYDAFAALPKLGRPELLDREADGEVVRMRVRYRFAGDLSAAARAVLDPARLTWVEDASHDLAARQVTFRMIPDHYGDRFRASGRYRFEPDGDGTRRVADGEVVVRTPLVGRTVERAIVSGMQEHLAAEVAVVEAFLLER